MMQSILVVEDDPTISEVVKAYLKQAGFNVWSATRGDEALRIARHERPSLVLLDLKLPDLPGEAVCREIKELGDIPVIMVTSKSSEEERITGFALGADDYVVKPFSPRELVFRVKAVLKRRDADRAVTTALSFNGGRLRIDAEGMLVNVNGTPELFTATEFRLLLLLASRPGKVFSREELVHGGLGYEHDGYDRCIDAHVKNIRHKLGDTPRKPLFVETVYGAGYRFNGTPDL